MGSQQWEQEEKTGGAWHVADCEAGGSTGEGRTGRVRGGRRGRGEAREGG